jgi:hypothetical protein
MLAETPLCRTCTSVHITENSSLVCRTAEWKRLKGDEFRERMEQRREKRPYKEERKISDVEKKRAVNKKTNGKKEKTG